MVRTFDKKINCDCGGTYLMSNKYKHFATNKHKNFIAPKELSENASRPVLEHIQEDYEIDIDDLIDYNEEESDIFWIINYPQDNQLVNNIINNYRSNYSRIGKSNKKKWVNNIFYNHIKSHQDIIHILSQTYKKATSAIKINFSLGIVTEELKEVNYEYHIKSAGELERFSTINEQGKNIPELFHIYNRRTFNNMIRECSEEKIINWLNSLLSSSSSKLIGVFSMAVKIIRLDQPIGCTKINLPDWILNSNYIISLSNIENNLCFFACIALAENCRRDRFTGRCIKLFYEFYGKNNITTEKLRNYEGIKYEENLGWIMDDEIYKYELMDKRFAINIYRLYEDCSCCVLRKSSFNPKDLEKPKNGERIPIFLNLYQGHFSYISNTRPIFKYRCKCCKRPVDNLKDMKKHEKICSLGVKYQFNPYPKLYVKPRNKIVELCDYYNIEVDDMYNYDYIICYDFEAINRRDDEGKIYQIPLSCAVYSNVPKFEKPEFYLSRKPKEIVDDLFEYIKQVQIKANELMLEKLKPLIDLIQKPEPKTCNKFDYKNLKEIKKYCSMIPILGFNNSSYDINLIMDYGFIENILNNLSPKEQPFILKNGKRFKGISTNKYLFLDAMLYCAAGTSLDKFIKCYNKDPDDHKFEFGLYRWLDKYRKLDTKIKDIPRSAFYNDFKRIEYTEDQYKNFQNECEKNNLITVYDLVKFYNIRDVVPFLKACLEAKKFFYKLEIDNNAKNKFIKMDMFKDGYTLPGLSSKIMNQFSLPDDFFKIQLPQLIQNLQNIQEKILGYIQQDKKRRPLLEESEIESYITEQEVNDLIKEYNYRCLYCHIKLNNNNWSLDRKNNNENHTNENCVISCINCNKSKSNRILIEFYQESYIKRNKLPAIYIIDDENKKSL